MLPPGAQSLLLTRAQHRQQRESTKRAQITAFQFLCFCTQPRNQTFVHGQARSPPHTPPTLRSPPPSEQPAAPTAAELHPPPKPRAYTHAQSPCRRPQSTSRPVPPSACRLLPRGILGAVVLLPAAEEAGLPRCLAQPRDLAPSLPLPWGRGEGRRGRGSARSSGGGAARR